MNLSALFRDPKRRKVAIAVSVGLVVGLVVIIMRRKSAASTSTAAQVVPTTDPATAAAGTPLVGPSAGSFDPYSSGGGLGGSVGGTDTSSGAGTTSDTSNGGAVYVDTQPIADALAPLIHPTTSPSPNPGLAPVKHPSPQPAAAHKTSGTVVWTGKGSPNLDTLAKAHPGEHLTVTKRPRGGYAVSATPKAPTHPAVSAPPAAHTPNPSAQPAAPAHPARPAPGTILWTGKAQPDTAAISRANGGVGVTVKRRGGGGYVAVAG